MFAVSGCRIAACVCTVLFIESVGWFNSVEKYSNFSII